MDTSDLAKRMKQYEAVSKGILMKRTPVIIRLDGKAFHTFTRGFAKPFDPVFVRTMQETMSYLCKNIQGCVLGYCQSDEISLVLTDYQKFETAAWFDYEIQKMCSISASMATMAFNRFFADNVDAWGMEADKYADGASDKLDRAYARAMVNGAMFDSRVFNLSKEEVTNYIYWRQLDASRNSIQMLGQAYFSHRQLQNKSCNDIQDMLMLERGMNWNDLPVTYKRGSCCVKRSPHTAVKDTPGTDVLQTGWPTLSKWFIDDEIPLFKGDGRKYIDDLVYVGEV